MSASLPVLVVDDNVEMLRIVEKGLGFLGYTGTTLADGQAAIAYLDANVAAYLCLIDVNIPGASGYAVLDHMVAQRHPARAVLMSGDGVDGKLDAPNLVGFLQKPFGFDELAAILDRFATV